MAAILATERIIVPGQHPELAGTIAWLARTRALVPVLPGGAVRGGRLRRR